MDKHQLERACFDGLLISTLAYGALLMLFVQLAQVLSSRPKRGRTFWAIVAYSSILFPLATLAIGGMLRFMEMAYIDHRGEVEPIAYLQTRASEPVNMMSQISTTLVPWIGDLLMLYRLAVVWDRKWWIIAFPSLLYISRVGMSIPLLISEIRSNDPTWRAKSTVYSTGFYSICVSLDLYFTTMISARIYMMRKRVETVMGKLHAEFYTGPATIFVESGAFFTAWAMVHVIVSARNSDRKHIFRLPYTYIFSITRTMVVLRMAQDRAWSKELVTACHTGVLDWQVSSTHSIPLHDAPSSSAGSLGKSLPRKFREDISVM